MLFLGDHHPCKFVADFDDHSLSLSLSQHNDSLLARVVVFLSSSSVFLLALPQVMLLSLFDANCQSWSQQFDVTVSAVGERHGDQLEVIHKVRHN